MAEASLFSCKLFQSGFAMGSKVERSIRLGSIPIDASRNPIQSMDGELTKEAYRNKLRSFLDDEDFDKTADAITPYVKRRLYEESFIDQVLAVRNVDPDDLIPETESKDDSYYVIGNVEQNTEVAVKSNFMDRPAEDYIYGERYKIPLGILKTRQFQKNTHELLAYDYDILEDAQEKDIYELGNLRDWELLKIMRRAVDITGRKHKDIVDTSTTGTVQVDKKHFNRLGDTLNTGGRTGLPDEDRLQVEKFLTSNQLVEDLSLLDGATLGDPRTGDIFEQGALSIFSTVLGQDIVTSIKERFFTEHEHVNIVQIDSVPTSGTDYSFTYGTSFTLTSDGTKSTAANDIANAISNSSDIDASAEQVGTSNEKVRIVSNAQPDEEERIFIGYDLGWSAGSNLTATVLNKGYDRFDTLWAFPSPEFIGEVVRVNGKGVKTEMWRTKAEDVVNRYSKEYFGMGIGNANGAAYMRIQRSRVI